jgi:molybdopterin-containing oxidoreductase family iron-sulfur binding subunit
MNAALGNLGNTVICTEPIAARTDDPYAALHELAEDLDGGKVDALFILGGNPVYNAPADIPFGELMNKAAFRAHLSDYNDETSRLCQWHLPSAHVLESWGDARAYDGTITLLQPLIEPLYHGKTASQVLSALLGRPGMSSHDLLMQFWRRERGNLTPSRVDQGNSLPSPTMDFDDWWRQSLHDGVVDGSAFPALSVTLQSDVVRHLEPEQAGGNLPPRSGNGDELSRSPGSSTLSLEILIQPDPSIWDGRFANNGWLQELPKPLTTLTWDNAAILSPATAGQRGLVDGQLIRIEHAGRSVTAPVLILPGHAAGCITLHLGYGRTHGGRTAVSAGFNAYRLRPSDSPGAIFATIEPQEGHYALARTQNHHLMHGRDLVRAATVEAYRQDPGGADASAPARAYPELSLFPSHAERYPDEPNQWGMAIDLNKCLGCNACMVACQSGWRSGPSPSAWLTTGWRRSVAHSHRSASSFSIPFSLSIDRRNISVLPIFWT